MESLHSDVIRIILGMTSPVDVKNFSITAKRNLRFLTDKLIWIDFCVTRTQFTGEVFLELMEGNEQTIHQCSGLSQKYPYNSYCASKQLVVGGNRPVDIYFVMVRVNQCRYLFTRGAKKMQYCEYPTAPGSPLCKLCIRKKFSN